MTIRIGGFPLDNPRLSNCTCPPDDGKQPVRYSLLCPVHGDPLLTNIAPKEGQMVSEHEFAPPLCKVHFTRSSTKDGGTGYSIEVAADCGINEANRIYEIAVHLKRKADAELRGPSLEEQLEKSIKVQREKVQL